MDINLPKRKLLPFIIVAVVTIIMFYPTFDDYFFASDFGVIEKIKDLNIRNFWRAEEFTSDDAFWWWEKGVVCRFFRPVEDIIRYIDYRIWGLNATGYHITNVVMHLLIVLIFTLLAYEIIKKKQAALIAALVFALHPSHNEPIMFIAARPDLTAGLFYIASFTAYVKFRQGKWKWGYPITIICFILALSSKEMSVTLPIMLFLYDIILIRQDSVKTFIRKNIRIYIPILIIWISYIIFYFFFFSESKGLSEPYFHHPLEPSFIPNALLAYLFYFVHFMAIGFFHPIDNLGFWSKNITLFIPFFVIAVALYIIIFKRLARERRAYFFVAWILVTFLPVTLVIMSQREMYIPSFGFCMIIGLFFERFPEIEKLSLRKNKILMSSTIAIVLICYIVINYFTIDIFGSITKSVKNSLDQIQEQLPAPAHSSRIIFVNTWVVTAGCLSQAIRLLYNDPSLKTHVLTVAPRFLPDNPIDPAIKPYIMIIKRLLPKYVGTTKSNWTIHDTDTIVVETKDDAYFSSEIDKFLLWGRTPFKKGETIIRDDFDVTINEVSNDGVIKLTFRFHSPIVDPKNSDIFISNGFINKILRY